MKKTSEILNHFSFSEIESEIYMAALALNQASVSDLAKRVGMGRTAAYFHIKNLIEKKVLQEKRVGNRIVVTAIPPSDLVHRLEEHVGDLKSLVPQLEALGQIENDLPQIEVSESNAAFEKIYDEVAHMPTGSYLKVIEDRSGAKTELRMLESDFWERFFSRMIKQRIVTKAVFTTELLLDLKQSVTPENYRIFGKRLWDIRVIPEEKMPMKGLVLIYGQKISFLFPETALTITIRHAALFHLIDTMFETIFAFGERVESPWKMDRRKASKAE